MDIRRVIQVGLVSAGIAAAMTVASQAAAWADDTGSAATGSSHASATSHKATVGKAKPKTTTVAATATKSKAAAASTTGRARTTATATTTSATSVVVDDNPVTVRAIVRDTLTWAGLPLDADSWLPDAPVGPVVETLWAAVRRGQDELAQLGGTPTLADVGRVIAEQTQLVLFDQAPTASPQQIIQTDGEVLGDLGIDDANDDAVTVTVVTGPTNGTLLLTTGGTYTYTPSAALAAAGGTDSFALAITDNGWHPLSTATATTTVTVPITVIATTDTAPAVPNTLSKLIVTNRSTATLTLTGLHSMGTASGTRVGDVLLPQADVTVYLSTSGSGGGVELLYLTVTTGATIVTYAAGLTVIGSSLRLDCISQGGTCSTQGNNTVIFT